MSANWKHIILQYFEAIWNNVVFIILHVRVASFVLAHFTNSPTINHSVEEFINNVILTGLVTYCSVR